MKKALKLILLLSLPLCAACSSIKAEGPAQPNDYDSCVEAGNQILKSFPPRCMTKDGKIFVQENKRIIGGKICKNQCGDGTCQQIVCQAEGCPCAESPENCPSDCAETSAL